MKKKNGTKRSLIMSFISLFVCVAMLIGATFAWFTDTASSTGNKIKAGNLSIALKMYNPETGVYEDISDTSAPIFGGENSLIAQNKNSDTLWEPNKTQVVYLAIENTGNLDLKYKVGINVTNPEGGKNLYEVMQYAITPDATNENPVTEWINGNPVEPGQNVTANDVSLPKGATHYFALSVHMNKEADNNYQGGMVEFDMNVYAAQLNSEHDSFGSGYDVMAEYDSSPSVPPVISVGDANALQRALEELNTTGTITLTQDIDLAGSNWASPTMSYTSSGEIITIDGQGHTISNLMSTGSQYGGLIGKLSTNGNVVIQNINLKNVSLTGTNIDEECAGGALIGWMDCHGGTVEVQNVTVEGVAIDGFKYTGGLIGYKNTDTALDISNCSVTGTGTAKTVNSSYNEGGNYKGHIGGLIGYYGNGTIENCTLGSIDITRSGEAQSDRAGVLVGTMEINASISSATVENVTLLGAEVISSSNMVGPGASKGTSINVTVVR